MNPRGKNILIGVVAALAVIGIYAAVLHKGVPGPWYSSPVASTTISSTTPAAIENPADWKTYVNDTYHITFLYPRYFGDLKEVSSSEQRVIQYNPATKTSVQKSITPLWSMRSSTDPKGDHPDLDLAFSIFPSGGYGFSDTPGGIVWSYASAAMWMGRQIQSGWGDWKKISSTLEGSGWKGYEMGTGDAGYSTKIVAIPLKNQNRILEMAFSRGPEAQAQVPANQILSTLKVK
jgi:hypothetical protein